MEPTTQEYNRLLRRYQREKAARKTAEEILEKKSRELFEINQSLRNAGENLGKQVQERTKELVEARDQALDAAKVKSEFLANMSHELRTPMNGVLGTLELLQRTQLNENQNNYVQIAKKSGDHLLWLINDILDFSKMDAGKMSLESIPFSLVDLIQETLKPFYHEAKEKNIELHCQLDNDIPDYILGDPVRVRQIVINLVSNAIKFTDVGKVSITVDAQGNQYQIHVIDSGIGITPKQLTHIFAAFEQGNSSITRTHGGTGLGLSIINQIAQLMGGRIDVSSEPMVETTFTITLPLIKAQHAPSVTENEKSWLHFSGQSVLLVEDNSINQFIAQSLLEDHGLTVTTANNGKDALEKVKSQDFDIVLMDLQMPVMDGLETTKHIRSFKSSKQLPIIAMTAHAGSEHIQECRSVGMDAHVSKPIDIEQLLGAISQWIPTEELQPKTEKEPQSKLYLPSEINGIDIKSVLKCTENNYKLLIKLLELFLDQRKNFVNDIRTMISNNSSQQLESSFHTLKGTSSNLGMTKVATLASAMEQQAKAGDIEKLCSHIDELEQALNEVFESICQIAESFHSQDSHTKSGKSMDSNQFIEKMGEFSSLLKTDLIEAKGILDQLDEYQLCDSDSQLLRSVSELFNCFDIDSITKILEQYRNEPGA